MLTDLTVFRSRDISVVVALGWAQQLEMPLRAKVLPLFLPASP